MSNSNHDLKVGEKLSSDTEHLGIAIFSNPLKKDCFAKAYKKEGDWVLVSDQLYEGGGLIVIINNFKSIEEHGPKSYIEVTKVLPNVVIGELHP